VFKDCGIKWNFKIIKSYGKEVPDIRIRKELDKQLKAGASFELHHSIGRVKT